MSSADPNKGVPTQEEGLSLYADILALTAEVEQIPVSSRSVAVSELNRLREKRDFRRCRYLEFVKGTERANPSRFADQFSVIEKKVAPRLDGWAAGSLVVIMQAWSELGAAIDRKNSAAMGEDSRRWAVLSMWVAAVSLVVSAVSFVMSMVPLLW